jgi:hypothetical protein
MAVLSMIIITRTRYIPKNYTWITISGLLFVIGIFYELIVFIGYFDLFDFIIFAIIIGVLGGFTTLTIYANIKTDGYNSRNHLLIPYGLIILLITIGCFITIIPTLITFPYDYILTNIGIIIITLTSIILAYSILHYGLLTTKSFLKQNQLTIVLIANTIIIATSIAIIIYGFILYDGILIIAGLLGATLSAMNYIIPFLNNTE